MEKKFMSGVYSDLHFIAELQENGNYKCIPEFSGGNGTYMNFYTTNPQAKFYDSLEDAIGSSFTHKRRQKAVEEERRLTGHYNREY